MNDWTRSEVAQAVGTIAYKRGRYDVAKALLETAKKFGVPIHPAIVEALKSELVSKPEISDEAVAAAVEKARAH